MAERERFEDGTHETEEILGARGRIGRQGPDAARQLASRDGVARAVGGLDGFREGGRSVTWSS